MVLAGDFSYKQISTRDGLPSNTVYSVLQDKKGDIWFATEYGVSRFNGFSFENFNLDQGLSDNDVFKLFQDSKGRIWFFLSSGKVNYFENGKIHNPENTELLRHLSAESYFNGFTEEPDGTIWLTTLRDGVFRISKEGKISRLKPISDLAGTHIAPGIWRDQKGEIRICTQAGIINLSRNPGIAEVPLSISPEEVKFSKILRSGQALLGLGEKLLLCRTSDKQVQEIGPNQGFRDNVVSNIEENTEGDIWISAINGMHVFSKGKFEKNMHRVYLQGKTLSGFLYDRQGNLWISTLNEGVLLVTDKESISFGKPKGIPDVPLTSLFFHANTLYLGNDRTGVGRLENEKVTMFDFNLNENLIGRGRIREFKSDPFDPSLFWIVSENGTFLTDGISLKGIYPSGIKTLEFQGDQIYIGGSSSCLRMPYSSYRIFGESMLKDFRTDKFNPERVQEKLRAATIKKQQLLPKTRVYKLIKDESGTIWMATHSGLFSLQFGKIIYHREQNQDFGYPFQNACLMGNGMLALSSNGRGVLILKPDGKIRWISTKHGLPSNYIRKLRPQGKDSLWVCTHSGLGLISNLFGESSQKIRNWTSFNSALVSNDVFDVLVKNDSLWLAAGSNLQCIPSFRSVKNFSIPRAEAESISINDKQFPPVENIEYQSIGNNFISIRLRNPDYRKLGNINFQYRFLPDTSWKAVNGNRIEEKIRIPGIYNVEIRRMLNFKPDVAYPLLQISLNKNITSIESLKNTDWYFRLPIFAIFTMLLLAIFNEMRLSQGSRAAKSLSSPVWDKIRQLKEQLFSDTSKTINPRALELFVDLQSLVWKSGNSPSLRDELKSCETYFGFLSMINSDFAAEVQITSDLNPAQFSTEGHPLLEFVLMHFPFPSVSGNYLFSVSASGNGICASLENKSTGTFISASDVIDLSPVVSF
jgi:ligand-binding sensor domain-containing protein